MVTFRTSLGPTYSGSSSTDTFVQGMVSSAPTKPAALLNSNGNIYSRGRTDYPAYAASQFASVKAAGAKGGEYAWTALAPCISLMEMISFGLLDGVTDDTTAIQNFINANWGCFILFFDAGTYRVTNTITIPTGSIVVGEIWTTVIGGFSLLGPRHLF